MKRRVDGGLIGEGLVDSMPMINENNLGLDSNLQFYYYFSSLLLWPVSEGTTKNDMDFTAPPIALDVQDGLGSDRRAAVCTTNVLSTDPRVLFALIPHGSERVMIISIDLWFDRSFALISSCDPFALCQCLMVGMEWPVSQWPVWIEIEIRWTVDRGQG